MLNFMERATIYYLKQKGWKNTHIAELTGHHRDTIAKVLKEEQKRTGIGLLWGTANLFSNRRYMHGAATSPNCEAFAFAAAQVKKALEVTKELGGGGYTFWGGREGYHNLWNTNMKRELEHLAKFLHMAVDYAKEIGFTGQFQGQFGGNFQGFQGQFQGFTGNFGGQFQGFNGFGNFGGQFQGFQGFNGKQFGFSGRTGY